ncbi:hypothetical protein DDE18_12990 [Nocardioides gansuensis]|uniref:Uncharacterized protein n=1 Tax=Nocardioides gansuensis TaxID=2138300 RepID=A0A2T8F9P2_9ACTN|nr:hypothetical protein [Nocardioides gansuensis]PVG82387.1 hypothetical protein DDE18_12990 [Nocardioides gansuensis]
MAEKDPDSVERSLELPSFGFGRKKRHRGEEPVTEPATDSEPLAETALEPDSGGGSATVSRPETVAVPPPLEPEPVAEEPPVEPEPIAAAATPATAPKPPREPREFTLPSLPPLQATIVTGAVVGVVAVGLNFAALQACDLIRGTTSCGGPGVLLLVAILILITYVGGWLLRGFHVEDAGSTAFLAVGLLTVVVMLFLVDALFSWWMLIVIPVLAVAAFVASWTLTTSFADVDVE